MTWTILHGDCRAIMGDGPKRDIMITDPPYSEYVHKSATSCGTPGEVPSKRARGAHHRDLGFEHLAPELMTFTCQLAAATPRWSVIFSDTESVGLWRSELVKAGAQYIRSIPWVRWSMPQLSGDRPPQGHEMVVVAHGHAKGKKSWNGPGNLTHFAHTCMRGSVKHTAQKPLDQMLDIVEFFSNPGETVFDPFAGSGTTILAANILNRNAVGVELDGEWAERAKCRLGTGGSIDDADRFAKYRRSAAIRLEEMKRMAANTARIIANRERSLKVTK